MGIYLGVTAVERLGTLIIPMQSQPPVWPGHRLVMVLDNGLWKIAVDVTDRREYDDFYASYSKGNWLQIRLYDIIKEQVKECPDEGRVESTYYKSHDSGAVEI